MFFFVGVDEFKYHCIDAFDSPSFNLLKHIEEAHSFIEAAKQTKGTLLIHCHAGISRSTTILASYIMRERGMTRDAALDMIRTYRCSISPNEGFMEQLLTYEEKLREEGKMKE